MPEGIDLGRAMSDLVRNVEVDPHLKADVERRIRARRLRHRRLFAAAVVVAAGSFAVIVPTLLDRSDGRDNSVRTDGHSLSEGRPGSEPGEKAVVLDGLHDGERWQLEAYDSADGLCVDLRYRDGAAGGCGFDEAQRAVGWGRAGLEGVEEAVFGTARSDVAAVDAVRLSGETLSFAPVVYVTAFDVGFYVFTVDAADPIVAVVARDASGTELDRRSLPDPTSRRPESPFTGGHLTSPSEIWAGRIEVDIETGDIRAAGFNDFIDEHHPSWAQTARGSAEMLIDMTREDETEVREEGDGTIVVTISGLQDDSSHAERYVLRFSEGDDALYRFAEGAWSQRCQPGRGHDDRFLAKPCV